VAARSGHLDMGELARLPGLGPASEKQLNVIGIASRADLEAVGPVTAYLRLKEHFGGRVSLNFLYAMVGGLEGVHWTKIARKEKARLLAELDGYAQIDKMFQADESEHR
jgi:TfoX C-terminal domain